MLSVLFVLVLAGPLLAAGITIKGKVAEVRGSKVKITYSGEYAPNVGERVQIGFEIGGEFIPVEGKWKIVEVESDFAWARAGGSGAGTPATDYLAVIRSSNPQKRASLAPPVKKKEKN